ncbi:kappa-type opioid receptor-like [Crassostrea angulata]|uniref:kappa-type opioid receptor-like n=1 Tax=Magallana angulata TaxID=2784310 RepID=UPI0022B1F76E|nr:kappa-type opioid receptor-like [Crassostrea angulata]
MDNGTILSDKLDKWNSDLARRLTPNNVILSLYIAIGLLGNSTVILIYGFKIKGNKEDRYFIPFLAFADLSASIYNKTFCSIFLLLIIAIHRYLKICRPQRKQMTLKWKRFAMCLVLIIAFALSAPMSYFYGSVSFKNEKENIVGLRCSRLKTAHKLASQIFGGIAVLTIIIVIFSFICLYLRIGYTIIKHFKYSKTQKTYNNTEKPRQNNKRKGVNSCSNGRLRNMDTELKSLSSNEEILAGSRPGDAKQSVFMTCAKRRKQNRRVVHKITLVFMRITVIFLICYIPKVIIMLLEARNARFWEEFSDSGRAGVLFLYRFFIINNIINPVIYAFMDKKFSRKVKLFCKICS